MRHDDEDEMNGNRHDELHDEDLDDEEEEVCLSRCNDEKRKGSSKNEELTEHECEQDFFNLLIDEHVCNNLHYVCLQTLTHEEDKFYRKRQKKNQNSGKKHSMLKKA